MSWLTNALSSSIGQKFVMGITGLLLCGFLVAHLAGNMLLFVGADAYNDYAAALHKQELLIKIAEAGLIALFGAHVYLAIKTTTANRSARKVAYAVTESKQGVPAIPGGVSSWMFATGAVVLAFVIWHLIDFTFEKRSLAYAVDGVSKTPYEKARMILQDGTSVIVYAIGCIALGLHLFHGVSSAFQSLGLNHPSYSKMIARAGAIFAILIAAGFISFVVWARVL